MLPVTAPPALGTIAARIDVCLDELLAAERARWAAFDADLAGPFDEIARMVGSGGKRLRPAFCHWGFVAAGGDPADERVVRAGAAFELMHAFALFHDDVMDDSASRRGAPTTHAVYAGRHGRATWAGESRRFGEGVAILVGDLAFVLADQLLTGAPTEVWDLWNELRIELNVGQYLDVLGSVQRERRLVKAERIARYKSGKYTIERPLHLGALLADPAAAAVLPALSAYGLPLGDAFQMRDDVIGAFGDPALTGKPVGDDLREGKPTPLLARAVALADDAQRAVLDLVGTATLDDDAAVAAVQEVIVATGALRALEARIAELAAEAVGALDAAPIVDDARCGLTDLADFVVTRVA